LTQTSLFQSTLVKFSRNGVLLVAIGAALWGMDSVFIVSLLKHLSSPEIIFLEHLLLALYAVPVVWIGRKQFKQLKLRHWGALLFIGWGGSAIASILFTQAFVYGNPSVVLILQKLQPVFAVLMAQWILRERLKKSFPFFLVFALVGTYLLTFGFTIPQHIGDVRLIGSLLALGAAGLWGGSTVMGRLLLDDMNFETVTAARFLIALPFLFVVLLTSGSNFIAMFHNAIVPADFMNLLFQALLPSLVSLLLYYRGLSHTKASYATLAELAFPATGLLLNWLVLGQGISWGQFVGFLIVWTTVFCLAKMNVEESRTWVLTGSQVES
jgi:drug/metabolite transporter (DMT)-like permease